MDKYKIIWTSLAKQDLQNIYEFWETKSLQGAKNVRSDILKSPKTVHFAKQYQVDDINPKYRRIVVQSNYKILYRVNEDAIFIMGIINTQQSTELLTGR
jgi:plasmid stabilization system protein ParE